MTRLPTATELPKPGAVHPTQAPAATDAQGFDVKRSKELKGRRRERQRTYLNPDGGYTTRFYTEPSTSVRRTAAGSPSTPRWYVRTPRARGR
ncbi:hypothetical protein ACFXDI_04030 [Streptomyces mirabilis]|uniref:hypothetical protein n=1 Tax=Streptomyces mirabilis TaxID=68239 RepID=UPI0036A0E69D